MRFRFGLILILAFSFLHADAKPLPPFSGHIVLDKVDRNSSHYFFHVSLRNLSGVDGVATELHLPLGVSLVSGSMPWRGQIPQGGTVDLSFVLSVPNGVVLDNAIEILAQADNGVHGVVRYAAPDISTSAAALKPIRKGETVSRFGRPLRVVKLK